MVGGEESIKVGSSWQPQIKPAANSMKGKAIPLCGSLAAVFFNDFIGICSNGVYGTRCSLEISYWIIRSICLVKFNIV